MARRPVFSGPAERQVERRPGLTVQAGPALRLSGLSGLSGLQWAPMGPVVVVVPRLDGQMAAV